MNFDKYLKKPDSNGDISFNFCKWRSHMRVGRTYKSPSGISYQTDATLPTMNTTVQLSLNN